MSNESQAFLIIRSEDRNKNLYPNPARFTITPEQHSFANSGIRSLEGESFQMLYSIPNVNGRNNTMVLDDGSTSYPITIPENFYTYPQLASEIETQINAVIGAGHSFFWDVAISRYVLNSPAPLFVTKYQPQKRDLAALIGFSYNQTPALQIIGGMADINYTRDIYVTTNSLHRNKKAQDQASEGVITDVLMVVPIYGQSEEWKRQNRFTVAFDTLLNPRNLFHMPTLRKVVNFRDDQSVSNIDILLLDDQGEELYNPYADSPDFSYSFRLTITANHQ